MSKPVISVANSAIQCPSTFSRPPHACLVRSTPLSGSALRLSHLNLRRETVPVFPSGIASLLLAVKDFFRRALYTSRACFPFGVGGPTGEYPSPKSPFRPVSVLGQRVPAWPHHSCRTFPLPPWWWNLPSASCSHLAAVPALPPAAPAWCRRPMSALAISPAASSACCAVSGRQSRAISFRRLQLLRPCPPASVCLCRGHYALLQLLPPGVVGQCRPSPSRHHPSAASSARNRRLNFAAHPCSSVSPGAGGPLLLRPRVWCSPLLGQDLRRRWVSEPLACRLRSLLSRHCCHVSPCFRQPACIPFGLPRCEQQQQQWLHLLLTLLSLELVVPYVCTSGSSRVYDRNGPQPSLPSRSRRR